MLCKRGVDKAPIEESCLNPFTTKDGVRGRFVALPNTEEVKNQLNAKYLPKAIAVTLAAGVTFICVSLGTQTTYGLASLPIAAFLAYGIVKAPEWNGQKEYQAFEVTNEVFSLHEQVNRDTRDIKSILGPIASALDLVVFDEQVARVEAYH